MPHQTASTLLAATLALLAASTGPAYAEGGFLDDGGSITSFGSSGDDRPFLEDGGSVTSVGVVLTPFGAFRTGTSRIGGDGDFLEDRGSITVPGLFGDGYRGRRGGSRIGDARRSILAIPDRRGASGFGGAGSSYYRGTGSGAAGGGTTIIQYGSPSRVGVPPRREAGAKIIHVASARLDRRPIGPGGTQTIQVGTTRIIRIAPGYSSAARTEGDAEASQSAAPEDREDLAVVAPSDLPEVYYPDPDVPSDPDAVPQVVPLPTPAPEVRGSLEDPAPASEPAETAAPSDAETVPPSAEEETASAPAEGFEPWTAAWLRDCVARYETFDASLGTYTDESGRRRFCTGEQ